MNLPPELERIRLSKQARNQLISLKRKTGIEHWNVLCRWAFCLSLVEPKVVSDTQIVADSGIEMDWRTFSGECNGLFLALLKERCLHDGIKTDNKSLSNQFKLHLHRGISYLSTRGKINNITDLMKLL